MSHKNRRRSINIPSEKMGKLRVTQKPDLPDFYSDKSVSFNTKLSSQFYNLTIYDDQMGSFAAYEYQILYCQL